MSSPGSDGPAVRAEAGPGLHIFADGSYAPGTGKSGFGKGGFAFVAYRDGIEVASGAGGEASSDNNAMELAGLHAAIAWVNVHAVDEAVTVWSDSVHAVKGCNSWRFIWKSNGWKKIEANPRARRRVIANVEIWRAIDLALSGNPLITVAWCKGHDGTGGNERADALAQQGRRAIDQRRP